MSMIVRISGVLAFETEASLEEALQAVRETLQRYEAWNERPFLEMEQLKRDGLTIEIHVEGWGPASSTFGSESMVSTLADFAVAGEVDLDFDEDALRIRAKRKPRSGGPSQPPPVS